MLYFLLFLQFLEAAFLLFGEVFLFLFLEAFLFFIFLVGQPLVVDSDVVGTRHCLCLADDALEFVKLADVNVSQAHQVVVVQVSVLKSVVDDPFDVYFLELSQQRVYAHLFAHFRAVAAYHGAEVEELAHRLAVAVCCLAGACRDFRCLGEYLERAVGGEVEHVALLLDTPVDGGRRLDAEYGLHVACGSGVERAGEHQHCSPFGYCHAGC